MRRLAMTITVVLATGVAGLLATGPSVLAKTHAPTAKQVEAACQATIWDSQQIVGDTAYLELGETAYEKPSGTVLGAAEHGSTVAILTMMPGVKTLAKDAELAEKGLQKFEPKLKAAIAECDG